MFVCTKKQLHFVSLQRDMVDDPTAKTFNILQNFELSIWFEWDAQESSYLFSRQRR